MALETWVQSQVELYKRLKKWHTQHYKVRIKGKVEQSRERSNTPLHLGVVAIEKGAFGSPSTTVTNFLLYISQNIIKNKLPIRVQICVSIP